MTLLRGLLLDPHRRHLLLTLLTGVGLALYLSGTVESLWGFNLALLLALVGGFPTFLGALGGLARRQVSADLAVAIAAVAAIWIEQYAVAAEVMFIMLIGEALEHFAIGRTRAGIAALLGLRPHTARVRREGHEHVVHADEVRRDDVVLVRPGDRIPVDGRVLAGHSSVDQSPITGESLPADKGPGDPIFAGTINLYGAMELAVERLGKDTALEQIIHLVEEAEAAKAPTQRLADRYATWFVPIVLAAALAVYAVTRDVPRSVAVLVVACPCALVLATPTAIAAGIGGLVRRGVLIKGGNVLEQLGRLRCFVFDKTGTLTRARLQVAQIVAAPGHDEAEVLRLSAAVEQHSEHPIARLLVERAKAAGTVAAEAAGFCALPGLGAEATVEGAVVRVGNPRFFLQSQIALPAALQAQADHLAASGCTVVLVARDREPIGLAAVADTLRDEAAAAVAGLRELGVARIVMLTGDNAAAAQSVAAALDIADVRSGLLPAEKVEAVRQLQRSHAPVAMVGDGINDAPSLVAADVGLAMADIGTDVAVASADVVLVGGDLRKLPEAVAFGRATLQVIWQNILGFALVFNVLAVAAAATGWIGPVAAAVLHQVSSLTVVLNSLRLLVDAAAWRQWLEGAGYQVARRWRPIAAAAGGLLLAAYAISGLHVVAVGEVAVVQQFGRVAAIEPPGLHFRLPYPLASHQTLRPGEVRRVELGFRTAPGAFPEPPAYDWNVQHRGGRYERQPDEATVWSGDESIADVNLVVQYRVADPRAALFAVGRSLPGGGSKWDALVRALAEEALRAEMSRRGSDELLSDRRSEIEAAMRTRLAQRLADCGTGFELVAVALGDVHPPLEVVEAFREVTKALEEKEARINQAEAEQFEIEARTRGDAVLRVLSAEGAATDRVLRAEGAAARFTAVAAAYAAAPAVTAMRLYLAAMDEALAGRRKVIVDRAPPGSRRVLWLGPGGALNVAPAAVAPPPSPEPTGGIAPP